MQKITVINESQRNHYEEIDLKNSLAILKRYLRLVKLNEFDHKITVLDIGGASGYFTKAVYDFLVEKGCEVEAYVLDTMRYPSWNESSSIIFCNGSVEDVDTLFGNKKFDFIFCNKVFHHFVVKGYSESLAMIKKCMKKLKNQLKENGKLCILDIFYDGLILDWFPSWMIYQCTVMKNPLLVKLFQKGGAKSAGSGVCFQSEQMWRKLLKDCGLKIVQFERGPIFPMKMIKQIVFLSHKPVDDNIFICCR